MLDCCLCSGKEGGEVSLIILRSHQGTESLLEILIGSDWDVHLIIICAVISFYPFLYPQRRRREVTQQS